MALLLVLNPSISGEDRSADPRGQVDSWLALDPHPLAGSALSLPAGAERARDVGAGALALPRGESFQVWSLDDAQVASDVLVEHGGLDPLAGTLTALAEAGGTSLTILSSLRGSPDSLVASLLRMGADGRRTVTVEGVPSPVRNVGLLRVELPARVEAQAERLEGMAQVTAEGVAPGTAFELELRSWFNPGQRREAPGDPAGEVQSPLDRDSPRVIEGVTGARGEPISIPFVLPGPARSGAPWPEGTELHLALRLRLEGDGWPRDDTLSLRIEVGPPRGGVVLVSTRPDGEPRVLLPLLERATGLEGQGWLQVGENRFVSMGREGEPLATATAAEVAVALERAMLLVVQGTDPWPPSWIPVLRRHPRILLLARAVPGAEGSADTPLGERLPGGWGIDPAFPDSPLRGFLVGTLDDPGAAGLLPLLPPLEAVPLPAAAPTWAAVAAGGSPVLPIEGLAVRRGGETRPGVVLHLGPEGERLAHVGIVGGWRWATREDASARFWRALWGGLAAWVLEGEGPDGPARATRALETGTEGTSASVDVPPFGTRLGAPLPPAVSLAELAARVQEGGGLVTGRGPAGEGVGLEDPALEALRIGPDSPLSMEDRGPRRPLRSHPAPWFAVLLLLAAEWVLRRQAGLR